MKTQEREIMCDSIRNGNAIISHQSEMINKISKGDDLHRLGKSTSNSLIIVLLNLAQVASLLHDWLVIF